MKTKIYFIISSIIAIIFNIYMMIISNSTITTLIESAKDVYSVFPQEFQDRAIKIFEKAGPSIIIIMSLFSIIFSAIILYNACRGRLCKNKGVIIGLCVACIFTTNSFLVIILNIINIIVAAKLKKIDVDSNNTRISDKIPIVSRETISSRDMIFSFLLLLIYFLQFIIGKIISVDINTRLAINIVYDIIMIILCIFVFYTLLKNSFKLFKNNFISYLKFIVPRIAIMYILFAVVNLIVIFITKNGTSANQQVLESLPKLFLIPAAVIYAPIVEELIFRGTIRRFIKNDILFIIVSGISFGLLHAVSEASILNVILISIPYSLLGCFLAYMYIKTNNICTNITCHALWNSIASIFMSFM